MIFAPTRADDINELLVQISEEINVPEGRQQEAKDRYMAVGKWLDADDSPLHEYHPNIHPQGSFAIGTAIRPVDGEEYDVDTVCLLTKTPKNITQQQLKSLVGDRLKQHATYAQMLNPVTGGRRCWTLKYAQGTRFHLDILPAIPDPELASVYLGTPLRLAETAILITDCTTWHKQDDWPKSNPEGYVRWFHHQMQVALKKAKQARAILLKANVSAIQDYEVRTPLQQAIQLLKRHRDINHAGDEDKPISIIITTLAAKAYENEATVFETLQTIIPRMRAQLHLDRRFRTWWVENPVNLAENFADKWDDTPNKADVFFDWLDTLEREFAELLTDEGFQDVGNYLVRMFGAREASKAITRYSNTLQNFSFR
ncbi:cyclic GMP-AMP synthase DncV-like nucleotidyltransferase [Armatimonas sp.]|uniref:SMODS domain-containing nucleotidyltransferase n=1 Tax=Armatimonas sp. TaxID=1872638 RepID=UPI003753B1DC